MKKKFYLIIPLLCLKSALLLANMDRIWDEAQELSFASASDAEVLEQGPEDAAEVISPSKIASSALILDLHAAFERAQEANLSLLAEMASVEEVKAKLEEQKSFFYPNISAELSQSRSLSVPGFFSSGSNSSTFAPYNYANKQLKASYGIFDINKWAQYYFEKQGLSRSQARQRAQIQEILVLCAQVFFEHIRNQSLLEATHQRMLRDESLIIQTQLRQAAGVATKLDLARARAQLAETKALQARQGAQLQSSALRLKQLLSYSLSAPIELESFHIETGFSLYPSDSSRFEDRPDYQAEQRALDQAEITRRAAAWQYIPKANLSAAAGLVNEELFKSGDRKEWSLGVVVSMPVFDGFEIRSQKLQAYERLKAQRYKLKDLEQQIQREQALAYVNIEASELAVRHQSDAFALRQEELALEQVKFESGDADNQDLLDAQANLSQSEQSLIEARFQLALNHIDYARSRGDVRSILSLPQPRK